MRAGSKTNREKKERNPHKRILTSAARLEKKKISEIRHNPYLILFRSEHLNYKALRIFQGIIKL